MGLLGPNGSGKTTIARLILNLIRADSGTIEVFGLDHASDEIAVKQDIGYVGEDTLLPPEADARWLSRFLGICFSAWDEALFLRYLSRFDVPPGKRVSALSRGTRVKLAVAAALAHRPRLLLLDEPTSGLDPIVRHEVVTAIREVADDAGRAVLFSSHIVSDLEEVADWVTVLDAGQVVTTQPTRELLARWRRLRFREAPTAGRAPLTAGGPFVEVRREGGVCEAVTDSFSPALRQDVERLAGGPVEAQIPSLEEVFRYLLQRRQGERRAPLGRSPTAH
jgi:ABC-2 type transport system ATP-binding protein